MTLKSAVERTLVHRREIDCRGYLRSDGLWDIEAKLCDTKTHDLVSVAKGEIKAGTPIHLMWLRITLDDTLKIHDAQAQTEAAPFHICPQAAEHYRGLVGMRIGPGWNKMVRAKFGGKFGCTHLTEMLSVMATVAIQTIYPYRNMQPDSPEDARMRLHPSLPNSCYGFARDGEIIRRYWPEYAEPNAAQANDESKID